MRGRSPPPPSSWTLPWQKPWLVLANVAFFLVQPVNPLTCPSPFLLPIHRSGPPRSSGIGRRPPSPTTTWAHSSSGGHTRRQVQPQHPPEDGGGALHSAPGTSMPSSSLSQANGDTHAPPSLLVEDTHPPLSLPDEDARSAAFPDAQMVGPLSTSAPPAGQVAAPLRTSTSGREVPDVPGSGSESGDSALLPPGTPSDHGADVPPRLRSRPPPTPRGTPDVARPGSAPGEGEREVAAKVDRGGGGDGVGQAVGAFATQFLWQVCPCPCICFPSS